MLFLMVSTELINVLSKFLCEISLLLFDVLDVDFIQLISIFCSFLLMLLSAGFRLFVESIVGIKKFRVLINVKCSYRLQLQIKQKTKKQKHYQ